MKRRFRVYLSVSLIFSLVFSFFYDWNGLPSNTVYSEESSEDIPIGVAWETIVEDKNESGYDFLDLVPTSDNGFAFIWINENENGILQVVKYDEDGMESWTKTLEMDEDTYVEYYIRSIQDGLVFLSKSETGKFIHMMNSKGEILWKKSLEHLLYNGVFLADSFDNGFSVFHSLFVTTDDSYAFETTIYKYDSSGDVMETTKLPITWVVDSIKEIEVGGYFIYGNNNDERNTIEHVAKVDADGSLLWQEDIKLDGFRKGNNSGDIVPASDGGLLFVGAFDFDYTYDCEEDCDVVHAIKYNDSGLIEWEKDWLSGIDTNRLDLMYDSYNQAAGFREDLDKGFTMFYRYFGDIHIMKTSSNGSILWEMTQPSEINYSIPYDVAFLTDGGYLITRGNPDFYNTGDNWELLLEKYQPLICESNEMDVGPWKIKADDCKKKSSDTYLFSENIMLNNFLHLTGEAVVNTDTEEITVEDGILYMAIPSAEFHGKAVLYEGDMLFNKEGAFALVASANRMMTAKSNDSPKKAGQKIVLGGIPFTITKLESAGDALVGSMEGELLGVKLTIEEVKFSKDGISFKSKIEKDISFKGFTFKDLTLNYDSSENKVDGTATVEIPQFYNIESLTGSLGFQNSTLTELGLDANLAKGIPLSSTGLLLTRIGAKIEDILEAYPKLSGIVNLESVFELNKTPAIAMEDVAITASLEPRMSLSGKMKVFGQELSEGTAETSLDNYLKMTGKLNVANSLEGDAELTFDRKNNLNGSMTGTFKVPDSFNNMIGGHLIAGKEIGNVMSVASVEPQTFGNLTILDSVTANEEVDADNKVTLELQETINQAAIHVMWDSGAGEITLITPDGDEIKAGETRGDIQSAREGTEAQFLIDSPEVGTYTIEYESVTGLTADLIAINQEPSFVFSDVMYDHSNQHVNLGWQVNDADDVPSVSFYYDTDSNGADGILIDGASFTADGSYTWDVSDLPHGEYYVYAKIDDSRNTPVIVYSDRTINHENTLAPKSPSNVKAKSRNGGLELTWSNTPGITHYIVTVKDTNSGEVVYSSPADDSETLYITPGVISPGNYQVEMVAVEKVNNDGEEMTGLRSHPTLVNVTIVAPTPPEVDLQWSNSTGVTADRSVNLELNLPVGVMASISQQGDTVLDGMTGENSFTFELQSGQNLFLIHAVDEQGNEVEIPYSIYVDNIAPFIHVTSIVKTGEELVISGNTVPGSELVVNEVPAYISADGRFHVSIPFTTDSVVMKASNQVGLETIKSVVYDSALEPTNSLPMAEDKSFEVEAGNSYDGQLNASDHDEGNVLTFSLAEGPKEGVVVVNEDGSFTYTANSSADGDDRFTYLVSDNYGGTDIGFVSITIKGASTPGDGDVPGDDDNGENPGEPGDEDGEDPNEPGDGSDEDRSEEPGDEDEDNTDTPPSSNDEDPSDSNEDKEKPVLDDKNDLPNTATPLFNYLVVGFLLVLIGASILFGTRRKQV